MQEIIENLTGGQMAKLIQIADPLTEKQREEFDGMSDSELLAALNEEGTNNA